MCLVRSWNFGFLANFIAEVLSIMSGVDCTCFTCKSSRIFLSHTISFVASAAATYSAFIVESAGTDCLRDLQETAPKNVIKHIGKFFTKYKFKS